MLARPITVSDISFSASREAFGALGSALAALEHFAPAGNGDAATQHENSQPSPHKLAAAYAAANSLTRRRFDAMLREADTIARAGLALILGCGAGPDRATIAAARFLGNSLTGTLRRMENLVASTAV
jgi:hypothetical protein